MEVVSEIRRTIILVRNDSEKIVVVAKESKQKREMQQQQTLHHGSTTQMFFRGIIFNLSGKLIYSRDQLKKMVEQYGAECDLNVTKKVTYCVAHPDEVDQGTSTRVLQANKYHIPFVHEQFIYDCISAGKLMPVKLYTIVAKKSSTAQQKPVKRTNKKRKNKEDDSDNEDDGDELMEDANSEVIVLDRYYGTMNRPEIITATTTVGHLNIKLITSSTNTLITKPDVYFGVKSIVHTDNVESESGPVSYSAVLYRTDDDNQKTMQFIIMQLLRTFIGKYILYMRYGPVGSVGKIYTEVFHEVHEATRAFGATFKEYSGSVWTQSTTSSSTAPELYSAVQFAPIGSVGKVAQGEQHNNNNNSDKDIEMHDSTEERSKSDRENDEEEDDEDRLDIADEDN